jgi:hypothetical protein
MPPYGAYLHDWIPFGISPLPVDGGNNKNCIVQKNAAPEGRNHHNKTET